MPSILGDLKANPRNPRKISDAKLLALRKALIEFGDLGGFVFNLTTGHLVGGHQRAKVLPKNAKIVITKRYEIKTKSGTVSEGYVLINGERFKYREVGWDEAFEKAANLAANKGGGEWDLEILSEWLREIDDFGLDLDLTMFDENERSDLLVPSLKPNFKEGSEGDQSKLDQAKEVECPECGHEFRPR